MEDRRYLCIDLKSFYASVECVDRGLDPMTTLLAVADRSRSEKTICLAISPAMKALGIKNRCRLFQIPAGLDYITAPPRMQRYIDMSAEVYGVYLKYVSAEDIHPYSIDEVFIDVTDYLPLYQISARELALRIMDDIRRTTGIPATAGIGTNLYLAKIALDITAKHVSDGIGCLDKEEYQRTLWRHRPLTDFWRIGSGIQKRLHSLGILTMEDITLADEELLYRTFGIDAELLIDHAWGVEPVTIADIKNYKPQSNCLSSGQVLARDYTYEQSLLIVKEMVDELCLNMSEKGLATNSLSLMIGYSGYAEHKPATGTVALPTFSNSYRQIIPHVLRCYGQITDKSLLIRRLGISCNRVAAENYEQYDLFTDPAELERDRRLQAAALSIKQRFGKNALVRGMDLQEDATTLERNTQIGGHRSGI